MKKIAIICLLCFGAISFINAQGYITALGLRYSGNNSGKGALGLTLQQRVLERVTLELIGEYQSKEPILTVLLEYHKPIFIKGLNIYVGGGGHTNLANLKEGDIVNNFTYGINGIVGAELRLPFFPLVISADIMPEVNKIKDPINPKEWDLKASTNISVRYVLSSDRIKRKKQKKKKKEVKQEVKQEKQEVRKEKREATIDSIKDKEKRKQWFEKLKDNFPKLNEKEKSSKK